MMTAQVSHSAGNRVFNLPELILPIVQHLSATDLYHCSQVNKQTYNCTQILLAHARLAHSAHFWLRQLAYVLTASNISLSKLKNNTFIFERLLEGLDKKEAQSLKENELKILVKAGVLEDQYVEKILTGITLKAPQENASSTKPHDLLKKLCEANLISASQYDQCLHWSTAKVNYLHSRGSILALFALSQLPSATQSEALEAFKKISDKWLRSGIWSTLYLRECFKQTDFSQTELKEWNTLVEQMVQSRLFLTMPNDHGNFPLHQAVKNLALTTQPNIFQPIIQYMVKHGANFNCKNKNGQTPVQYMLTHISSLSLSEQYYQQTFVKNLNGLLCTYEDARKTLNEQDRFGYTVLDYATLALRRHPQYSSLPNDHPLYKCLIQHGATPSPPLADAVSRLT